jgi:hypothetical protein
VAGDCGRARYLLTVDLLTPWLCVIPMGSACCCKLMMGQSALFQIKALLEEGTLNPAPEKVRDPKFQENEFSDPRDVLQVKYEMLRRISIENVPVTLATEEYGVLRPTYYQSKDNFDQGDVAGLVPRKRGLRGPHKLQGEALAFVEQQLVVGKPVWARGLAKLIRRKFDLHIHPRTIERAVAAKKLRDDQSKLQFGRAIHRRKAIRDSAQAAPGDALPVEARCGLMIFLRQGMWGWARAVASMSKCQPLAGSWPSGRKAPEEYRTVSMRRHPAKEHDPNLAQITSQNRRKPN